MQLPDESVEYNYQGLLMPVPEAWTPAAELQSQSFLSPERLELLKPILLNVRMQIASERTMENPPPKLRPLDAGFIDLPQRQLDQQRRKGDSSELGRILAVANRLKADVDRVVILGIGGSYLGARTLFEALCNAYH